MRAWIALPLCFALLAAGHARAADAPRIEARYTFTRVGQNIAGTDYEVQVSAPNGGSQRQWIARRVRKLLKGDQTDWIDGRQCPALADRMATLKTLEPLTVSFPGDVDEVVVDGALYTFKLQGYFAVEKAYGEMSVTGNVDTPLAKWAEDTMTALKPCWQDSFPR